MEAAVQHPTLHSLCLCVSLHLSLPPPGASLVIVVTHGVLLADGDASTDDIQLEEVSVS